MIFFLCLGGGAESDFLRADIVRAVLAFFARAGSGERRLFFELVATPHCILAGVLSFKRMAR